MIDPAIREGIAYSLVVLGLVVIFAPIVAQRLRLPGLLGLLIGGALIGPNVLGVLDDFSALETIGEIGILYLIFLAGLQLDRETFRRYSGISIGFGAITSAVSLVLGTAVGLSFGYSPTAAILIGSFWASFTLIAYPVLQQYNLSRNRAGAAVIGASAVTDAVSLFFLAAIVGLESGGRTGLGLLIAIVLGLAILAAWCLLVLPLIARWFFSTLGRSQALRFMLVLVGLMSAAVLAEIVGVEPLLGAFFAGLGLNRAIPNESPLMEHVAFVGNALFIPVFLISVGLLFDPAVMFVPSTLWLAVWLSVALVAGKAIAAWVSGRLYRLTGAESGLLFSVSVAQAAATLAGTIIGYELGLYGQEVVNAVMVVIGVSLVVTSVGTPRYAARIEPPSEDERRLGERVLLTVRDAGGGLTDRLRLAGMIASAADGIVLPTVIAAPESGTPSNLGAEVARIDDELHALGLEGRARVRVDRTIVEGIANAAVENDASLVVLGWSGPEIRNGFFSEGIADELSRRLTSPVIIVEAAPAEPKTVLLIATEQDTTPTASHALRVAAGLALSLAPKQGLIVGPVDRAHLVAIGIEPPDWARYEAGARDVVPFVERLTQPGDLIVAIARGRVSEGVARAIEESGRSVILVPGASPPRWVVGEPPVYMRRTA